MNSPHAAWRDTRSEIAIVLPGNWAALDGATWQRVRLPSCGERAAVAELVDADGFSESRSEVLPSVHRRATSSKRPAKIVQNSAARKRRRVKRHARSQAQWLVPVRSRAAATDWHQKQTKGSGFPFMCRIHGRGWCHPAQKMEVEVNDDTGRDHSLMVES